MSWKTFRNISEPLEDMSYERYLRIIGLFDAIPISDLRGQEAMVAQFRERAEAIAALVAPDKTRFVSEDGSDLVHNLQLLLMQLLPLHVLTCFVPALREDFREAVGDAVYQRYLAAETSVQMRNPTLALPVLERLARADALYVVNETRNKILAQRHIEETRAFLLQTLSRGWRRVVMPFFVFLFLFFLCKGVADLYVFSAKHPSENSAWNNFIDRAGSLFIKARRSDFEDEEGQGQKHELPQETALYQMLTAAALLSFAGLAGACGAFVSVVNRIQRVTDSSRIGRNIWVLKNTSASVAYTPAIGATFAIVLSIILAGGLISGSLFPQLLPDRPWFFTFWRPQEMAKWLVWAFIAGFSERLVPDMLDRLTARASNEDKAEPITSPPPKVTPPLDPKDEGAPITPAEARPTQ